MKDMASWRVVKWVKGLFSRRPERMAGTPEPSPEQLSAVELWELYGSPEAAATTYGRRELAEIYDRMYDDPLIGPCIETIVDYATAVPQGSEIVEVKCSDKEVRDLVSRVVARSGLAGILSEITRDLLLYGDAFVAIDLKSLPTLGTPLIERLVYPWQIQINWDPEVGRVKLGGNGAKPGEAAYERYVSGSQTPAEQWGPWEVVHIAMPPVKDGYGRSILYRLIVPWQQYTSIERTLASGASRGGKLRIHYIPVPARADMELRERIVKAYQEQNARVIRAYDSSSSTIRSWKVPPARDLFVPVLYWPDGKTTQSKIEVVEDGDASVKREDMLWWVNKVFSCLRVPPELLYWDLEESKFSRGSSSPWEEGWARHIQQIQSILAGAILKVILRVAASMGKLEQVYNSDLLVQLPKQTWRSELDTARALLYRSQAISNLMNAQVAPDTALRLAFSGPSEWDDIEPGLGDEP